MRKDTLASSLSSVAGMSVTPGHGRGRVVGSVDIVLVNTGAGIVGRGARGRCLRIFRGLCLNLLGGFRRLGLGSWCMYNRRRLRLDNNRSRRRRGRGGRWRRNSWLRCHSWFRGRGGSGSLLYRRGGMDVCSRSEHGRRRHSIGDVNRRPFSNELGLVRALFKCERRSHGKQSAGSGEKHG